MVKEIEKCQAYLVYIYSGKLDQLDLEYKATRRWIVAQSYNPLRHALLFSMDLRVSRGLPPVLYTVGL